MEKVRSAKKLVNSISVVMATYNGEKYILGQLESLYRQTRPADEVIICDDRSTDSTAEMVEEFIRKYSLDNWHLHINDNNIGFRKNFLNGIRRAGGDIIFLCDQDDFWDLNKIRSMSEVMSERNDVALLACGYTAFRGNVPAEASKEQDAAGAIHRVSLPDNMLEVPYPGCTYCLRKSFFKKCEPYWMESCPHDAMLWRCAVLDGPAFTYDRSLIFWRKHEESAWTKETEGFGLKGEIKWRSEEEKELKELASFVEEAVTENKTRKVRLVADNLSWVQLRQRLYTERSVLSGLKLIRHMKRHGGLKACLRDWKVTFLSK